MTKKHIFGLSFLLCLAVGCTKKPDSPAPQPEPVASTPPSTPTSPPPPPPPVTNCQGATILWSLPGGEMVNDNSTRDFVIPGFEYSCGDSLTVFIRNPQCFGAGCWTQLFDINNHASYYSVLNQTVTVHNSTGIIMEVAIEAVLK